MILLEPYASVTRTARSKFNGKAKRFLVAHIWGEPPLNRFAQIMFSKFHNGVLKGCDSMGDWIFYFSIDFEWPLQLGSANCDACDGMSRSVM